MRGVLPLVNARSRSRPESRLRLVWLLDAHLPVPLVNPEVCDDRGRLPGLPDLLDAATGLVAEYDGARHGSWRSTRTATSGRSDSNG